MTNSLSPPTDSLYKFIAISGLLLFFSSGYLNYSLSESLFSKLADHYVESQLDSIKVELHQKQVRQSMKELKIKNDSLNQQKVTLDSLLENANSGKIPVSEVEDWTKTWELEQERYSAELEANKKILLQYDILESESVRLHGEHTQLAIENTNTKSLKKYLTLGMILGIIISAIGFYLWYHRIQIFLDKKLKYEYSKLVQNDNDEEQNNLINKKIDKKKSITKNKPKTK
ncbi:hypothetical protein [Thalassobellus sediminis]|uniref:hypothetical protein n=1 Tax=Thalassobellus sediminis TaxID=3367753 RepID=UPI003799BA3B